MLYRQRNGCPAVPFVWMFVIAVMPDNQLYGMSLCPAPEFFLRSNRTMCTTSNPWIVFEDYVYLEYNIPLDLSQYNPALLHHHSILHEVDELKRFKAFGSGSISQVFFGQLRKTNEKVVVKQLKEDYQSFTSLENEIRLTKYLEVTGRVPKVFGLLPTGTRLHEASIVMEYIQNSTELSDLVKKKITLSECHWLNISLQIAESLWSFHNMFVLFNDLHQHNILVQWRGEFPMVYVIDFGHATFRRGKSYSVDSMTSFAMRKFLAPEVSYSVTTPASDVYSMGNGFYRMSKRFDNVQYLTLIDRCLEKDPQMRIALPDAVTILKDLLRSCSIHLQTGILHVNHEIRSQHSLSILEKNSLDLLPSNQLDDKYLIHSGASHIYRSKLLPSRTDVIFKVYRYHSHTTFIDIRKEALVNLYLKETKYVLGIFGVAPCGPMMVKIGIIQEYFTNGITLSKALRSSQSWTYEFRVKVAFEISNAVAMIHNKLVIINNLKSGNILINIYLNTEPTIKIIDLDKANIGIGSIFEDDNMADVTFLAPEVREGDRSSFASDVYGLGEIIQALFSDAKHSVEYKCSEISYVVDRCMSEYPSERFTAADVASIFEHALLLSKR